MKNIALVVVFLATATVAEESFYTQADRMRDQVRESRERINSLTEKFYEKTGAERDDSLAVDGMMKAVNKIEIEVLILSFSAEPHRSIEYLRGQVDLILFLHRKIEEEIVDSLLKKEN